VAWSPAGNQIAQSFGSVIDIWNAADGTYQRTLTGNWNRTTDLIWTTDNRLVMGNVGGMAIVLNPDDGSLINYFLVGEFGSMPEVVWSLDFSPDGSQLVMGLSGGYVMVWGDTYTEETMTQMSSLDFVGHTDSVRTVDWSPDGRFIATGSRDKTVRIWDAVTGEELYQAKQDLSVQVNSVAWSPDGSQLAYGQPDGTVAFIPAPEMPK
jgi:WD40 repeat protein